MTSPETKPILIDADDAAYDLKDIIVEHIRSKGHEVIDLKHMQEEETYYPGVAYNLAKKISGGEADKGILICGTGLGMAITANKVKGVFAGTCHDVYSAERLRKSNNANVLTFGARVIGSELAKMVVDAFLDNEFAGGGSTVKVEQMRSIDNETLGGCC